jgi:hypothetical protein
MILGSIISIDETHKSTLLIKLILSMLHKGMDWIRITKLEQPNTKQTGLHIHHVVL